MCKNAEFERVYGVITGELKPMPWEDLEEIFDKDCGPYYDKVCEAHLRIAKAIDGGEAEENGDVLNIISAYETIMKILCEKCYGYGFSAGEHCASFDCKNNF